jgi:hypothetical protein
VSRKKQTPEVWNPPVPDGWPFDGKFGLKSKPPSSKRAEQDCGDEQDRRAHRQHIQSQG